MDKGAWRVAVLGGHKESDMTEHAHMQFIPYHTQLETFP